MSLPERPQLRPCLAVVPQDDHGLSFVLWDQLHLSDRPVRVTAQELQWLRLFDGRHTLRDLQARGPHPAGVTVPLETFTRLARQLDEALFLDGPRFRERLRACAADPVRPPACLASYEPEPAALRHQLDNFFTGPGGPGRPRELRPDGLRAALVPHIDYGRGGTSYAWAYKEVFERCPASLFVIIGTSHYSRHRFTLTRKHFRTPLGIARTDGAYIDRLVRRYGAGLFDDELLAHLPEHSVELEVVFLQHLYDGRRPIRIVPLVVGSFADCVTGGHAPGDCDDVGRMVEALRAAERDTPEPIGYLISGDLAHIGPKFGDAQRVTPAQLDHCRRQDHALLARAEAADPAGYFRVIADEDDRRRICGLPPTWTVLEALRPAEGKLLHYDQYVHPRGQESVSFASMAFYR
jgi:AmmeMemoRadiSam system protein B